MMGLCPECGRAFKSRRACAVHSARRHGGCRADRLVGRVFAQSSTGDVKKTGLDMFVFINAYDADRDEVICTSVFSTMVVRWNRVPLRNLTDGIGDGTFVESTKERMLYCLRISMETYARTKTDELMDAFADRRASVLDRRAGGGRV